MNILTSLTYYRPYTSGLTIYAERLARALSERGHKLTILCMQHDSNLAQDEILDSVRVLRAPVVFKLSKGFISIQFIIRAIKEIRSCDLVQLHLPQFEGAFIALFAFLFKKPLIATYHCDLIMPKGLFNQVAGFAVQFMNHITARIAKKIVTYTEDFANNFDFLKRYKHKVEVIFPPVILPSADSKDHSRVSSLAKCDDSSPCLGMAARLAAEKGVEVLVDAVNCLKTKYPKIKVIFAGPYLDVVGESEYRDRVLPKIKILEESGNWVFLGNLSPAEMSAFYPLLDILVVSSLNSTESFGLVQVEAMQAGVPVISSNLPGVRQPVLITQMGKVVEIGNSKVLADEITNLITDPEDYSDKISKASELLCPQTTALKYENLYSSESL